jgi:hypothetical protein
MKREEPRKHGHSYAFVASTLCIERKSVESQRQHSILPQTSLPYILISTITSLLQRMNLFMMDIRLPFQHNIRRIGFEILTELVMMSSAFWDMRVTPCSQLKVNGCFGGTCRLHIQRSRMNQARN